MQIQTSFTGNLVEDPTLRITPSGHAVTNFRVAVNNRHEDRTSGQWKDTDPTYLTVTAWRRLAENTAESLHRGDTVVVTGRLQQRDYQTEQGDRRTTYEIEADSIGASLAHATVTTTRNPRTTTPAPPPPLRPPPPPPRAAGPTRPDPGTRAVPGTPDRHPPGTARRASPTARNHDPWTCRRTAQTVPPAPATPQENPMLSYEETMRHGAAAYSDVTDALAAAGLDATFTQTGGMNAALEIILDGASLLITDADDSLSWDRGTQQGWSVGLYTDPGHQDTAASASNPGNSTAALLDLIGTVLRAGTRRR